MMLIREHFYGKKYKAPLIDRTASTISIDPGQNGAACVWRRSELVAIIPLDGYRGIDNLVLCAHYMNSEVLVIESQYSRINARAAIQLARYAGAYVGAIAQRLSRPIDLVWILPSSWQHGLFKMPIKTQSIERKKLAHHHAHKHLEANPVWHEATKPERQGIADAYCIGAWWQTASNK